jgi:hypothetical protein
MAFVKYKRAQVQRGISSRTIGISKKGRFAFYKPVISKHFNEAEHVELYFDPEKKSIGILPVNVPTDDSFKIQGKSTKMVIAKKFLNKFQIPIEDRRYEFEISDDDNMMVVRL